MLKTVEVYVKDCTVCVEHSLVANVMMVLSLINIMYVYVGYKGFKEVFLKKKCLKEYSA